ncbi:MAG: DMT family transporter [Alphaproteobacteria bacterium]|nr:DMT family transporter [Alphaproteobacteria bacterium]
MATPPPWADAPPWGFPLVALAGTCFAVNSTLARVAYDAGSDALTVNTVRACAAVVIVFLVFRLMRVRLRLPLRTRLWALGLGAITAGYSYALFKAIEYIPVALAVLIFYTYPFIVAVASWLLGRERPTWGTAGALIVAFVGLSFALDIGQGGLDPLGVFYAALTALGFGAIILVQPYVTAGQDSRAVTMHMLATTLVLFVAASLLLGHLALPKDATGGLALAGVVGFYCFAFVSFYIGLSRIGPIATSLAMNFEPVASVVLGHFLLGQHLRPGQLMGAGLVVAAILASRLLSSRQR